MNLKQLITEAININNGEEVVDAIKNKTIGCKVNKEFKELNGNTESFVRRAFDEFIKKCNELNIKNYVYGIQFLLSHTNDINLNSAVKNDAIYEYLRDKQKPWSKNMSIFKLFETSQYEPNLWHKFEKDMQEESSKHGKVTKGSGIANSSCEKYNDGSWSLEIPNSFKEEQAIAFYTENGKKTPCHWCTRADERYYNYYTNMGKRHLYIIKNLKTGRSYQLAFSGKRVDFLDDQDEKGDEITYGDLRNIPDKLLSLIKDENVKNGKTLLDFKNDISKDVKPRNSREIKAKEAWSGGSVMETNLKFGKPELVSGNIYKAVVTNYSTDYMDSLSKYFEVKETGEYKNSLQDVGLVKRGYILSVYHKDFTDKSQRVYVDPNGMMIEPHGVKELPANAQIELKDTIDKAAGGEKRKEREEAKKEDKEKQHYFDLNMGIEPLEYISENTKNQLKEEGYDPRSIRIWCFGDKAGSTPVREFGTMGGDRLSIGMRPVRIVIEKEKQKTKPLNFGPYEQWYFCSKDDNPDSYTTFDRAKYLYTDVKVDGEPACYVYDKTFKEFKMFYNLAKEVFKGARKSKEYKAMEEYVKKNRDETNENMRNNSDGHPEKFYTPINKPYFESFEY